MTWRTGGVVPTAALAIVLSVVVAPAIPASAAPASGAGATLTVGSISLTQCGSRVSTYCGRLPVPLNWGSPASRPRISVCFEWLPATHTTEPALGTVLPVEGGPGYPSIGSVEPAVPGGYDAMYGSLLERYDMLVVDLRGTGCSTPVDCPALQEFSGPTGTRAYEQVVGSCGESLDHRWRMPGGSFVHASDLFTSAAAADDVAAVVEALGVGPVNLYGDSYGSWFAQVFASRFPNLVRSVVLDSTYQVLDLDPWYRTSIQAMPADFDLACSDTPSCASATSSAWADLSTLAARLRSRPVSARVPGPGGSRTEVSMGVVGLANLVSDAAEDPFIYRGIDAAARAILDEDDPAPLLRLYAQRLVFDEDYFDIPATGYSAGLYMAVSCLDYPQLFDMDSPPAARRSQLAEAERTLPASTFAPFSTGEFLAIDQNTEDYTGCLDWPAPTIAQPSVTTSPPLLPATVPVLILGGQLDTWTPPVGVPVVERELGADSRFVLFNGATHVVGETVGPEAACSSSIIDHFVSDPSSLQTLNVSCASALPQVRAVGEYPSTLGAVPPLVGTGSLLARQLAAAAVMTAGDAVARWEAIGVCHDDGLVAGTATATSPSGGGVDVRLRADELVPGVPVTGSVLVSPSGLVTAALTAGRSAGPPVVLRASWPDEGATATATVTGSSNGSPLSGTMSAP